MATEDTTTIDEQRRYLRKMQERYLQADCREWGQTLDEMEAVTALHRKSLIRLMKSSLARQPRRRQRSRTYGPKVDDALRVIAESSVRTVAPLGLDLFSSGRTSAKEEYYGPSRQSDHRSLGRL
jgi:hypothetical protein